MTSEFEPAAAKGRLLLAWSALKRDWPIWLVATATFANGLLGILTVLLVRFHTSPRLLNASLPFGLYHWTRSLTLVFGFVLLYLSFHLFQRQRAAWWLALIGSLAAVAAHIGRGHQAYLALAPAVTVLLLVLFRSRFRVRSEPRSIAQGLGLTLVVIVVALAYGTVGFSLLEKRDFGVSFPVSDALTRTLREFTLIGNADLIPRTRNGIYFLESLRILGILGAALAVYSLFRPVAYRLRTLPLQRAVMKSLLEQYGGTSLDYFKLWPDKSYFFSQDRRCGIAYVTARAVALCLGDPAGFPEEFEPTVRSFLGYCADNGWDVAFHQAAPQLQALYRRAGLQSLKIGEEAIVDLELFAGDTLPRSKHMRHNRNKFVKEGYVLSRQSPPHPHELLNEIEEVSREWLTLPGHHERSFALGYFDRGYMNECSLAVLRESTGRVIAFANEIPSYRPGEATVDLMRHRVDAPNGTMDYLFAALMLALKEQGYRTFDLGLAPYAGVGDSLSERRAPLEERAAHQLAERLTMFFDYKGMRDYKAKYDPAWEERFFTYQGGPLGLVRAALALVQVSERVRS